MRSSLAALHSANIARRQLTSLSTFTSSALPSSSSLSSTFSPMSSNLTLRPRRSEERGASNHGWLNSRFTFSFADYFSSTHHNFGRLRVINEDRVTGGNGFGRHPHRDAEIFSYIVSGALKHDDSLGHSEVLKRGEVQFTSTGSGIAHSEYNASQTELVHFLQIWATPDKRGLPPNYQTRTFPDSEKEGQLRLIVSPDGAQDSIRINTDMRVYATLLQEGQTVTHPVEAGRQVYVHVVMDVTGFDTEKRETSVEVNAGEETLLDGDGAFIELADKAKGGKLTLTGHSKGSKRAEVLVFDMVIH